MRWMRWAAPAAAVMCGSGLMYVDGAPPSRWAVHGLCLALALLLFVGLRRVSAPSPRQNVIGVGLLLGAVASSLLAPGLEGIHRWVGVGVIRVHPSALVSPLFVVLAAQLVLRGRAKVGVAALVALQLIHLAQPDAGQATAVAVAGTVLIASAPAAARVRLAWASAVWLPVAAAWLRADPLGPAPYVEDILQRAVAHGPGWVIVAVLTLASGLLSPMFGRRGPLAMHGALVGYLVASVAVASIGEFPMALLGYGPSPLIGCFLALSRLSAIEAESTGPSPRTHSPSTPSIERRALA